MSANERGRKKNGYMHAKQGWKEQGKGWLGGDETERQPMRSSASWGREEGRERERAKRRVRKWERWKERERERWERECGGGRERVKLRQSLWEGRLQCGAFGCELLSSNQPLPIPLTETVVCGSSNCAVPAVGGAAAAQAQAQADWLVPWLGCLRQSGVDWSWGLGKGRAGLAVGPFVPGPHRKQTWAFLC